jgi:hypothetical protein
MAFVAASSADDVSAPAIVRTDTQTAVQVRDAFIFIIIIGET